MLKQIGQAIAGRAIHHRLVGPARLRWSELTVGGKPVRTLRELMTLCCGEGSDRYGYSSGLHQRVLGSDEWIQVVRIPREGVPDPVWDALVRVRHDARMRACYCSVLDDCWVLDSDVDEPAPVAQCPAAPPDLWGG